MDILGNIPALVGYGVVLGSILTLGAVGLTLIYGIARFGNFAHGDLMTVGAYIALFLIAWILPALGLSETRLGSLSFGWPLLLSFIPIMLIVGGVAVLIDKLVYRRLRKSKVGAVILAISSLAMAFILRSIVYIGWGADFHFYSQGLRPMLELPLGIKLRPDQIFIIITSWVLVGALYVFLQRTKMGKALRAMADNPDLARISGIPTERMTSLTWLIGGGMAAAGGILLALDAQLRPDMGWSLLLPLFAAVILGSIGNPVGALIGAMIIGISQQVSTLWLSPAYKQSVAFLLLILILLIRPKGIFGGS
jgi:branched-chain amino acid transport system permease protein/neutral amino acid transport system permease protein